MGDRASNSRPRPASWALLTALVIAAAIFRLPPLLNAGALSSDAAVVGLQARHILRGEWSWFLWGAGYQSSFDALVAAVVFAATGAGPRALMVGPLVGYLLVLFFTFDILARRLGPTKATIATLAIALSPQPINMVSVWPPRQWSVTFVFAAIWLTDRAAAGKGSAWKLAAGAFLAVISLYLDLFATQFLAGAAVFAISCAAAGKWEWRRTTRQIAPALAGALAAALLVWLSHRSSLASGAVAAASLNNVRENWPLLCTCLPFLLGYDVYVPGAGLYPDPWHAPPWYHAVQIIGVIAFAVAVLLAGLLVLGRRVPRDVARLGMLGLLVTSTSLAGFLVSGMPADVWSARYLAPLVWVLPFTLAPLAWLLKPRRLALWMTPYLLIAAVGGWMAYGPFVHGPTPVLTQRGAAREERDLASALRARNVHCAAAQYWLAYRLTFLFAEDPLVVPLDRAEDRYPPYRRAFEQASPVAYLFHPSEPRAKPEDYEQWLKTSGVPYEKFTVHDFTVLVVSKQ